MPKEQPKFRPAKRTEAPSQANLPLVRAMEMGTLDLKDHDTLLFFDEVIQIMLENTRPAATAILMEKYSLTNNQCRDIMARATELYMNMNPLSEEMERSKQRLRIEKLIYDPNTDPKVYIQLEKLLFSLNGGKDSKSAGRKRRLPPVQHTNDPAALEDDE